MKFISPKIHMIIDFLVVVFLLAAPTLFDLTGFTATFTYALAGVHLLLTLMTDFGSGLLKIISFSFHGLVELLVGIALIIMAFTVFEEGYGGHLLYLWFGIAVLLTWLFTDYEGTKVPKLRG